MSAVCFYFQVHQPYRLKRFSVFDVGNGLSDYFGDESETNLNNRRVFRKVAEKCYLPVNKLMLELLKAYPDFKISYSFSGVFLEQAEEFYPEVIKSFRRLIDTGRVEVLSETYYHSLAFLYSPSEFNNQVEMHTQKIHDLFGVSPNVFRNTELIYSDELASYIEDLGYKGIITEGADKILGWRSPNYVYQPKGTKHIKLLLKNYKLSDDIAFRFSDKEWVEHPLTTEKYANWIHKTNGKTDVINLFMDYETFGEHQWEDSGIFNFLRNLPLKILEHPDNSFVTPSEAVELFTVRDEVSVPEYISWADVDRDLSAWRSNDMQHDALEKIYEIGESVKLQEDEVLLELWRRLQTSDHFYYMCTKWFADGDVHKYFNPYESPYEAYITYMNVLRDLALRLQ